MTDAPDFRFRADLFRIACRFASMADGVRIEPAPRGEGAILTAWTDLAAFAILDVGARCARAAMIRVPHEFLDATHRAVRAAPQGEAVCMSIVSGVAMCDGVGLRAENCVREAEPDNWRAWARRNGNAPLVGSLSIRRDLLATIGDAAQMLVRAGGGGGFDAERAPIRFAGGVEGAVAVEFPAFRDAFVIVRDAQSDDDHGKWKTPAWLEDARPPALDFKGRAPPEAGLRL